MSDLISRSETLNTLENIFNDHCMAWDKQGGFAGDVPKAIRGFLPLMMWIRF